MMLVCRLAGQMKSVLAVHPETGQLIENFILFRTAAQINLSSAVFLFMDCNGICTRTAYSKTIFSETIASKTRSLCFERDK